MRIVIDIGVYQDYVKAAPIADTTMMDDLRSILEAALESVGAQFITVHDIEDEALTEE